MPTYTVIVKKSIARGVGNENPKEVTGDLPYLQQYFGYTLECGNSWNKKINRYPKTIKSFISNLQKSYEEKEAACYNRTHVSLKEPAKQEVSQSRFGTEQTPTVEEQLHNLAILKENADKIESMKKIDSSVLNRNDVILAQ
jgi:hypothetical protein